MVGGLDIGGGLVYIELLREGQERQAIEFLLNIFGNGGNDSV